MQIYFTAIMLTLQKIKVGTSSFNWIWIKNDVVLIIYANNCIKLQQCCRQLHIQYTFTLVFSFWKPWVFDCTLSPYEVRLPWAIFCEVKWGILKFASWWKEPWKLTIIDCLHAENILLNPFNIWATSVQKKVWATILGDMFSLMHKTMGVQNQNTNQILRKIFIIDLDILSLLHIIQLENTKC